MKLEWLGEYRGLVEHNIKGLNAYVHYYNKPGAFGTDTIFSLAEIQVIEYILENEERKLPMGAIASRLGVSPSTFSRIVNRLTGKGLLEKYYLNSNKKNIIVKVSDYGKAVYKDYSMCVYEKIFKHVFELYDKIPREYWPIIMEIDDLLARIPPTVELPQEDSWERIDSTGGK